MTIQHCDQCNKSVDTDQVEMERFCCGEDDYFHACPDCAEKINAEYEADARRYKAEYDAAPLSERNPEQYRREMREAGRGHLLAETWEE